MSRDTDEWRAALRPDRRLGWPAPTAAGDCRPGQHQMVRHRNGGGCCIDCGLTVDTEEV